MERFLANYKPPLCKKARESEKEVEKSRKYENEKRKRRFNPSWKASFGWLEYHVINEEGKMFYNTCRRYDHTGSFSVGNMNVKLETIKAHARSQSHRQYQLRLDAKRRPEDTVAHKMLMAELKHDFNRQGKLMFTMDAMIVQPHQCPMIPCVYYMYNIRLTYFRLNITRTLHKQGNSDSSQGTLEKQKGCPT